MRDGQVLGLLHKVPESVHSSDLAVWLKSDIIPFLLSNASEEIVCGVRVCVCVIYKCNYV